MRIYAKHVICGAVLIAAAGIIYQFVVPDILSRRQGDGGCRFQLHMLWHELTLKYEEQGVLLTNRELPEYIQGKCPITGEQYIWTIGIVANKKIVICSDSKPHPSGIRYLETTDKTIVKETEYNDLWNKIYRAQAITNVVIGLDRK